MIYTDTLFVILLLGLWLVAQTLRTRPVWREWLIIAFSLLFVASWGLFSLALLLAVALVNFVAIRLAALGQPKSQRTAIVGIIVLDLTVLAVFKYGRFIISNLPIFPTPSDLKIDSPALGVPLEISFYTFHLISYLNDLSARKTELFRSGNISSIYALSLMWSPVRSFGRGNWSHS
jgi:alginate O-acetyltransferase complex protein AlgI